MLRACWSCCRCSFKPSETGRHQRVRCIGRASVGPVQRRVEKATPPISTYSDCNRFVEHIFTTPPAVDSER